MEAIVDTFALHIPPDLLYRHRDHFAKMCSDLYRSFYPRGKMSFDPSSNPIDALLAPYMEDIIPTGSCVEGTALARLFSSDSETAAEVEFDIMFQIGSMPAVYEKWFCYVPENHAFFHIKLNENDIRMAGKLFGENVLALGIVQTEEGTFMNSLMLKIMMEFARTIAQPILANFAGGYPTVDETQRRAAVERAYGLASQRFCDNFTGDESSHIRAVSDATAQSASAEHIVHFRNATAADNPGSFPSGTNQTASSERLSGILTDSGTAAMKRILEGAAKVLGGIEESSTEILDSFKSKQDDLMTTLDPYGNLPLHVQATETADYIALCMALTNEVFDRREALARCTMGQYFGIPVDNALAQLRKTSLAELQGYSARLSAAVFDEPLEIESTRGTVNEIKSNYLLTNSLFLAAQEDFRKLVEIKEIIDVAAAKEQPTGKHREIMRKFHELLRKASCDFVSCAKLDFWPNVANEWLTRERQWPDAATIDTIARNGTHAIMKQFCHPDIDWRLSFSIAEIALAKLWTVEQHYAYFMFKSLFYKFIKTRPEVKTKVYDRQNAINETGKKSLASYLAKTAMLHVSESFPQNWWNEEKGGDCLTVLLLFLQSALESRHLEHYFVRSVNLLEGIPPEILERATKSIEHILADPASAAAQLKPHFVVVNLFLEALEFQREPIEEFKSLMNRFSQILTR